jgi:hypothetical protein
MMRNFAMLAISMWASVRADWVDSAMPAIHNESEYPDEMHAWKNLEPAWKAIHSRHHIGLNMTADGLPLLPCVSFPDIRGANGTKLFTVVVRPWPCNKKRGAILVRSPYGPTTQNIALIFTALNGFTAVMQDQRGTMLSGGKFDMFRTDGVDGIETIKWITSQEWSNGDIYTAGISADGISSFTPAITAGQPIKGMWGMWTTSNGHHFVYPGGAYRRDLLHGYFNLMDLLGEGRTTAAEIEADIWRNEDFGPWWYNLTDVANLSNPTVAPGDSFKHIHWPVMFSMGWWDIFQGVALRALEGLYTDRLGDPAWRDKHVAIIDPLGHCAIGNTKGFALGEGLYKAVIEGIVVGAELASEFFAGNTNGRIRQRIGRLNFYLMSNFGGEAPRGTPGNYWVSLDNWPNFTSRTLFMQPGGVLSEDKAASAASQAYIYDPSSKNGSTPMLGGNNLPIVGQIARCGSTDQKERDSRSDVIVFDSGVLSEHTAVVGKIRAKLFVSSSAKDTDFVVTLSDLGKSKSMLVRYGAIRMRWRNGGTGEYLKPAAPLVNGTVYEVDVKLDSVGYVFPKGHRVRVSVSSAAYPYYDANPNTGSPETQGIPPAKFEPVSAKNVIHMGPQFPTSISLPVVKIEDVPRNPKFSPTLPPLHSRQPELSVLI